jgi:hypothetical protein
MNNIGMIAAIKHEISFRILFLELLKMGFSGTSTGALSKNIINTTHIENQNTILINKGVHKQYFAINAITMNIENETIRHL